MDRGGPEKLPLAPSRVFIFEGEDRSPHHAASIGSEYEPGFVYRHPGQWCGVQVRRRDRTAEPLDVDRSGFPLAGGVLREGSKLFDATHELVAAISADHLAPRRGLLANEHATHRALGFSDFLSLQRCRGLHRGGPRTGEQGQPDQAVTARRPESSPPPRTRGSPIHPAQIAARVRAPGSVTARPSSARPSWPTSCNIC